MIPSISLWQPYATLLITGVKFHETRGWPYPRRGVLPEELVIHAAKKIEPTIPPGLDALLIERYGKLWRETIPRGAILGTVQICACLRTEDVYGVNAVPWQNMTHAQRLDYVCGDFGPGRFAWKASGSNRRELKEPIPYRGKQGLFYVPRELLEPPS